MTISNNLFINKAKTCAVTGHRVLNKNFDSKVLTLILKKVIKAGFDTFLVGMAIGFDTECFKILLDLKKENKITLVACVPCETQSQNFNQKQKEEYDFLLSQADEKVLISKEYTKDCMLKRNRFMVDNCSGLIAYCKRDYGGTASTVRYAIKTNVPIIYID